ncbi:MAG: ACT domain-containing protein [Promethearchaeota archaeon]
MLTQLSVYLPNSPGVLASFIELLMKNNINIRSMTVAETEDYGLLLLLVDKPLDCVELLDKKDYTVSITKVIAINLSDNINGLYKIAKIFGEKKINIEYLYSTMVNDESLIVLRVNDDNKAMKILEDQGFNILHEK